MSDKSAGEASAYPTMTRTHYTEHFIPQGGLTKREAFAMAAMQGLVMRGFTTDHAAASEMAVRHADALLARLNQEPTP